MRTVGQNKPKPVEEPPDPLAYYKSIQVTPEEREKSRAEMLKRIEEASRNGVYEKIISLRGKVHFDMEDLLEARGKGRRR
jgi:hypothetical protein